MRSGRWPSGAKAGRSGFHGRRLAVEPLEERTLLSVSLFNPRSFLSGPSSALPLDIAVDYLTEHAEDLGIDPTTPETFLDNFVVTNQYVSQHTGVTHIYLGETFDGLDVVNADINVNIAADGEVINVGSSAVSTMGLQPQGPDFDLQLTASDALSALATGYGWSLDGVPKVISSADDYAQTMALDSSGVSLEDIPASLSYVAMPDGGVELAWNLNVQTPDLDHWYDAFVSVETGELLLTSDWVSPFSSSYSVFDAPLENPDDGARTLVVDPYDPTASPYGWHDTNGIAGAEFTDTQGNNVSAQEDRDNNNSGGHRPSGGAGPDLVFDFPINFADDPTVYEDAAITNLFYWNNVLHDIHYQYGFDEAAGNFQENNYGHGGSGSDSVNADAQDGSGYNNANFATPPDGSNPRMQQYIFTYTSPRRDSDLDNGVIIHEYGHGVSNRLTRGPANSSALQALQSRGMGEGWSDFYSLMFTQKPSDGQLDAYPVGTYVLGQSPGGPGIRRFPYSFDMAIKPLDAWRFQRRIPEQRGAQRRRDLDVGPVGFELAAGQQVRVRSGLVQRHRRQQPDPAIGDGRDEAPAGEPVVFGRSGRHLGGGPGSQRRRKPGGNLASIRPPGLWGQRLHQQFHLIGCRRSVRRAGARRPGTLGAFGPARQLDVQAA